MDQAERERRKAEWKRGMDEKFATANKRATMSDEERASKTSAYSSLLRNIPSPVAAGLRAKDLGTEGLRQAGKYGKGLDPRLAALENIGGQAPMTGQDLSQKWDATRGSAMSALKKIPGMNMKQSTLRKEVTGIDENRKPKKMTVSEALDNVFLGKGGDPRLSDRYNQKANLRANIESGTAFPVAARTAPTTEGRYLDPSERDFASALLGKAGAPREVTSGGKTLPAERVSENIKRSISDEQGLNILKALGYR
jgi:hypothetical protein